VEGDGEGISVAFHPALLWTSIRSIQYTSFSQERKDICTIYSKKSNIPINSNSQSIQTPNQFKLPINQFNQIKQPAKMAPLTSLLLLPRTRPDGSSGLTSPDGSPLPYPDSLDGPTTSTSTTHTTSTATLSTGAGAAIAIIFLLCVIGVGVTLWICVRRSKRRDREASARSGDGVRGDAESEVDVKEMEMELEVKAPRRVWGLWRR
jgi:hypothetical protein